MSGDRFERAVGSTLDWSWNWGGTDTVPSWLAEGETITDAVVTVPAGLTKSQPETHDDTTVTVWLTGGEVGTEYPVVCRITTSEDRTDERTLLLHTTRR